MLARHRGPARAEGEVNDVNDARLCHPGLRINRVLRVMLHTRLSAEAWPQVKAEFTKALALRSREEEPFAHFVDQLAADETRDQATHYRTR